MAAMHLSHFILKNVEPIVAEWETFAATLLPAAEGMSSLALRDHAHEILEAVAKDLGTARTPEEQEESAKGLAPEVAGPTETAAQTHAILRARSGFDINQLVAESVGHFHAQVDRSRNLFLGMPGHDMRSPLNKILTTAQYLADLNSVRLPRRREVRPGSGDGAG